MKAELKEKIGKNVFWCLYMICFAISLFLMASSDIMTDETARGIGAIKCHYPFMRGMMIAIAIIHTIGGTMLFGRFIGDLLGIDW